MQTPAKIEELLLFLLESQTMVPMVISQKLTLRDADLFVSLSYLNNAIDLYKIDIYSDDTSEGKSVFFAPVESLKTFIKKFYEKAQEYVFVEDENEYIRRNGHFLRNKFLTDLKNVRDGGFSSLDNLGRFHGKTWDNRRTYLVEYSCVDTSNPNGIIQMRYVEVADGEHVNQTFFVFSPEEVRQYPLIKSIGLESFSRQTENQLDHLPHPLVNYFFLQEKMSHVPMHESSRKSKI